MVATGQNEVQSPKLGAERVAIAGRERSVPGLIGTRFDFGHWTLDFGLRCTRSLPLPVLILCYQSNAESGRVELDFGCQQTPNDLFKLRVVNWLGDIRIASGLQRFTVKIIGIVG